MTAADPLAIRILQADALLGASVRSRPTTALAVKCGRVLATGAPADLRTRYPNAVCRDLRPWTLAPAFCDHHLHLGELVRSEAAVDLGFCRTESELTKTLAHAAGEGEQGWLLGAGLNLHAFGGWSTRPRDVLAAISRERPVLVRSTDLHSLFANPPALIRAGLADHPDGALQEHEAFALIEALPLPTGSHWQRALDRVATGLHEQGIVRLTDMSGLSVHERMWAMASADQPPLKVTTTVLAGQLEQPAAGVAFGARRGRVSFGWVKLFLDGSFGSASAWMLPPALAQGGPAYTDGALTDVLRRCRARQLPLAAHAIGDGAVRQAARTLGPGDRIEHCQHAQPEDLTSIGQRQISVCANPQHLELDWRTARDTLPKHGAGAYALGSMLKAGIHLCFGSDAPVVAPAPLAAARWAVTRQTPAGEPAQGWHPSEGLSPAQALAACWSCPDPLAAGRPADLVALSDDPLRLPPEAWPGIRVERVWLDGRAR